MSTLTAVCPGKFAVGAIEGSPYVDYGIGHDNIVVYGDNKREHNHCESDSLGDWRTSPYLEQESNGPMTPYLDFPMTIFPLFFGNIL